MRFTRALIWSREIFLTQDENNPLNSLKQLRKQLNENKNTKKYKEREQEMSRLQIKARLNRMAHERQKQPQPQQQQLQPPASPCTCFFAFENLKNDSRRNQKFLNC